MVAKLLAQGADKGFADASLLVKRLKGEALLGRGVTAHGADVDHAVAELDKGAALDGDLEVGNVVEDKLDELLVVVLAEPLDEGVGGQLLATLVGSEAVLGKGKVEEVGDRDVGCAQLLLLLDKVAAADKANGNLLAKTDQEVKDLRGGVLEEG